MRIRLLFVIATLFCSSCVMANAGDPEPTSTKVRKDEINGTVVHADNKRPLKNVSITAYSSLNKKEATIISNESGIYFFDELKPGTYRFVFEKSGFKKTIKDKVIIRTDEAFQMNIEMIESVQMEVVPSPLTFGNF